MGGIYIKGLPMPRGEDEGFLIAIFDGFAQKVGTREEFVAYEVVSEMEKTTRWIPVTERLPEGQFPVQVYVPPHTDEEEEYVGYVGMAYHTNSARGGFWCGTDGAVYGAIGIIHEPSYWMPLPEAPKEET